MIITLNMGEKMKHKLTKSHRTYCDDCRKYVKIGYLHENNNSYYCNNCYILHVEHLKQLIIDFRKSD